MKPLLRSTRRPQALATMLQAVQDFLPEAGTVYADPFCGTADAPFELELKNCILNDHNPHFINFYQHVKNGTFLKGKNKLSINTGVTRQEWSKNRSKFNKLLAEGKADTADAAQLTFYLSHTCATFTFIAADPTDNSEAKERVFGGAQDLGFQVQVPEVDWQAARDLMQDWKILHLSDYTQFFEDADIQDTTPLVVSAPIAHAQQWNKTVWREPEHEVLLERLNQHPGNVLLFHPTRRSIQAIYSVWSENGFAPNHRVFQALPRR